MSIRHTKPVEHAVDVASYRESEGALGTITHDLHAKKSLQRTEVLHLELARHSCLESLLGGRVTRAHKKVINPDGHPQTPREKVEGLVYLRLLQAVAQHPVVQGFVPAPRCSTQAIQRLIESNHVTRARLEALWYTKVDLLVKRSIEGKP
jgi:hypothetical protein